MLLETFSRRSEENAREAKEDLFGVQNSRKAYIGRLAGLQDPALMGRKTADETKLREAVARDDKLKYAADSLGPDRQGGEGAAPNSCTATPCSKAAPASTAQLFAIARTLVRAGEELPKKSEDRLREFRQTHLDESEVSPLLRGADLPNYEIAKLTDGLTFLAEQLGYDDPLVQKVLAGKSPPNRAAELVNGCKAHRAWTTAKKLYKGGKKAVDALERPDDRCWRNWWTRRRGRCASASRPRSRSRDGQAYAELAKAKFAVEGTDTYPDATFTLRLAFGQVKGYEENGKHIPFETTFAGLYERAAENHDKPPFDLPPRWVEKRGKLDLKTPLNFVCTADIIGGNSGSPVVNRDAELVGIIFDGNIQSLVLDFAYSDDAGAGGVGPLAGHHRGAAQGLRRRRPGGRVDGAEAVTIWRAGSVSDRSDVKTPVAYAPGSPLRGPSGDAHLLVPAYLSKPDGTRARRKPRTLYRKPGVPLLRNAARQYPA